MTITGLCDIECVGHENDGPGKITTEFHCLTHDVYWISESMYAPLRCHKAQKNTIRKRRVLYDKHPG